MLKFIKSAKFGLLQFGFTDKPSNYSRPHYVNDCNFNDRKWSLEDDIYRAEYDVTGLVSGHVTAPWRRFLWKADRVGCIPGCYSDIYESEQAEEGGDTKGYLRINILVYNIGEPLLWLHTLQILLTFSIKGRVPQDFGPNRTLNKYTVGIFQTRFHFPYSNIWETLAVAPFL